MSRVLKLAMLLCWVFPLPVAAQWIDYELLFQEHAGDLIEIPAENGGVKTVLEFDSGVRITRTGTTGDYRYHGEDLTTHGAVGCSFDIVLELRLYSQICPKLLEGLEADSFESAFWQLNKFVALNGYPAISPEEGRVRSEAYIRNKKSNDAEAMSNICVEDKFGEIEHLRGFFQGLIDLEETGALKEMLAVPRLPVSNPCL